VSGCQLGSVSGEGFSYVLDRRSLRVVRRVKGFAAVFAAGSIWAVYDRSIYRIDPQSGIVLAKVRVPGANPDSVAGGNLDGAADGSVWTTTDKTVVRISTTTNAVTNVIPLPGVQNAVFATGETAPSNLVLVSGKIWLTQFPSLYEIDPATNIATQTPIKVGPFGQAGASGMLAVDGGTLLVRTTDRLVVRFDPQTLEIQRRYRATGGGGDIAVAFGSLWVANAGYDTTWREPLG
jgi:glutamine cyclotransferase